MNPLDSFAAASGAGFSPDELYGLGPGQIMYPGLNTGGTTAPPPVTPPVVKPPKPPGTGNGGNSGNGGNNTGNGSGSGTGSGGNEGGGASNAGGAGDNAGHPGRDANGNSLTAGGGSARNVSLSGGRVLDNATAAFGTPSGYISIPDWADNLWTAAGVAAPGIYGTAIGAAHTAARGYQAANTDALRENMGYPGMSLLQWAGALPGFNRYGDLSNPLAVNREQAQAAHPNLTAGISGMEDKGYYDPGLIARVFGATPATEYTPEEARKRNIAAGAGNATSLGQQGNDSSASPTGQAYGMVPGAAKQFGPAIVAGDPAPKPKQNTGAIPAGWSVVNNKQTGFAPTLMGPNGQMISADGVDPSNYGSLISNQTQGGNKPTGMGGNGFSGNLSAGAGNAVSAGGTGGLQNGFGGGGYADGGYIQGDPAIGDHQPINATPGEFMMNRDTAQAAPQLMATLNANPGMAMMLDHQMGGQWGGPPRQPGVQGLPAAMQPPPMRLEGDGSQHGSHWGGDGAFGGFFGHHGRRGMMGMGGWGGRQARPAPMGPPPAIPPGMDMMMNGGW